MFLHLKNRGRLKLFSFSNPIRSNFTFCPYFFKHFILNKKMPSEILT
ncbi:hypothetical protein NEISICOT_01675 [Neisseria sicca ATCC 29256]|uniref:Uncharacterized protein n=1 Tax=Neisseria sicca ATCC 29256 TaxID=547045 RepID=C6M575_NEISI|nr:hypothetical protein NEISICOT_01675 [Neisseria sicca ATCC 29256]